MILQILFWGGIGLILYTYFGYPVFLYILSLFRTHATAKNGQFEPMVSLVITAYNEASVIREKLENSLRLDYPAGKLEIIVVSDCSTDQTDSIVREYESKGIQLLRMPERHGKTIAQNAAVNACSNEIIVFSDANAMYQPDAIRKLIQNFADAEVGCVCGELTYINQLDSIAGQEENLYWKYEQCLKRMENQVGTILGANGSIYAIRKEVYIPLGEDMISDFIEPLRIVTQGNKLVYEPEAISTEVTCQNFRDEFRRKKRIVLRSIYGLFKTRSLLNIFKFPMLAFQLVSHKVLRWATPLFLILIFLSNILLISKPFYGVFFVLHVLFYVIALLGYAFEKRETKQLILYAPFYFCMVNLASLLGIIGFLQGKSITFWQPPRNTVSQS